VAERPLTNRLRVASVVPFPGVQPGDAQRAPEPVPSAPVPGQQLRKMPVSQFTGWLRTQTSTYQRPFSERAIEDYAETARALDRWMTGRDIDEDFTACGGTACLLPASRCRRRSSDLLLPVGAGFFLPAGVSAALEVAGDLRCFPAVVHAAPSAATVLAVIDEQRPACTAWLDVAGRAVG
jgi:hypothetical protein